MGMNTSEAIINEMLKQMPGATVTKETWEGEGYRGEKVEIKKGDTRIIIIEDDEQLLPFSM